MAGHQRRTAVSCCCLALAAVRLTDAVAAFGTGGSLNNARRKSAASSKRIVASNSARKDDVIDRLGIPFGGATGMDPRRILRGSDRTSSSTAIRRRRKKKTAAAATTSTQLGASSSSSVVVQVEPLSSSSSSIAGASPLPSRDSGKRRPGRPRKKAAATAATSAADAASDIDGVSPLPNRRRNSSRVIKRSTNSPQRQRNELLQHDILTKEDELRLGKRVARARKLRRELKVLIDEKRLESFGFKEDEKGSNGIKGGDDGRGRSSGGAAALNDARGWLHLYGADRDLYDAFSSEAGEYGYDDSFVSDFFNHDEAHRALGVSDDGDLLDGAIDDFAVYGIVTDLDDVRGIDAGDNGDDPTLGDDDMMDIDLDLLLTPPAVLPLSASSSAPLPPLRMARKNDDRSTRSRQKQRQHDSLHDDLRQHLLQHRRTTGTLRQQHTSDRTASSLLLAGLDLHLLTESDVVHRLHVAGGKSEVRRILLSGALARDTLMKCNVRLVNSICKKWLQRSRGSDAVSRLTSLYDGNARWDKPSLDELMQEGLIGLARAVDKYDPDQGWRFATYSTHWINSYVRGCLQRSTTGCLKVPVQLHDIQAKYKKLIQQYAQIGDPIPSQDVLAAQLNVSLQRLTTALRVTQPLASIDAPMYPGAGAGKGSAAGNDLSGDNSLLVSDTLPCHEAKPEEHVEISFLRQCLENAMATELSPYERDVLRLRLGLDGGRSRTVREVMELCGGGVSMNDVRSTEQRAFRKLRSPSSVHTSNLLSYLDYSDRRMYYNNR